MISTYVYGSPHGFNFYEGSATWNDYFKSFYISTRKGKRLMVNRKDDGSTIYSFLCYGLMETEGRPNAFFGCSIIVDDYKYSPDLKILYEWFDYLFEKLVSRGNLFHVNEGGILQYKVDRFSDIPADIDWLKANLPNIFTKSSDISLRSYDNSFAKQNLGKVICCNIDTPASKIIDSLRKVHWVAISPNFSPEQDVEEINISDLESKLNRYNQSILSIAVNPSVNDLSALESIKADCMEITASVREYRRMTAAHGSGEDSGCGNLISGYSRLADNISALISKIRKSGLQGKPVAVTSGKTSSPTAQSNPKSKGTSTGRDGDTPTKRHSSKPVYLAIPVILVVIILCIAIIPKSSSDKPTDSPRTDTTAVMGNTSRFNPAHFQDLLTQEKYVEALDYLNDVDNGEEYIDKPKYLTEMQGAIYQSVLNILEKNVRDRISEKYDTFKRDNMKALTAANCDIDALDKLVEAYRKLAEIEARPMLSATDREEAIRLIQALPAGIRGPREERIRNIPSENSTAESQKTNTKQSGPEAGTSQGPFSITLVNTDTQGKTLTTKKLKLSKDITETYEAGTYVELTSNVGVKLLKGSGSPINNGMKVEVPSKGTITLSVGNIKVNIKSKPTSKSKKDGFQTVD